MLQSRRKHVTFLAAVLLLAGASVAAAPLFTLSEDGKTFLYRAGPGDLPGVVAKMFGIAPREVPAFLAANGISDAKKVGPGFVYHIPNAAARALAERMAMLEAENARLKRGTGDEPAEGERVAHAAAPLFTLSEDGQTFLYRAGPGDHPGVVAEMFGIAPRDVPGFLAANGITDARKVGTGFVYRIPNVAARALAERTAVLEAENARLTRAAGDEQAKAERLAREAEDARAEKTLAESRVTRLERLERLWPWVKATLGLLIAAAAGALYTGVAALRRQTAAERYARSLAVELEEKRKAALAERQESARHVLDLEQRIRTLEAALGPRAIRGSG